MNVFWFRRDLRLEDNRALNKALTAGEPVLPIFIFDTNILDRLPRGDARVEFIRDTLEELDKDLRSVGSSLEVFYGTPMEAWSEIVKRFKSIKNVFCAEDYEPYAIERDHAVTRFLKKSGIEFHTIKDQVIFARDEIVKDNGEPYRMFTPYAKRWLAQLQDADLRSEPSEKQISHFAKHNSSGVPSLKDLGFEPTQIPRPGRVVKKTIFVDYAKHRDQMGEDATSHLGMHLRFGTISIRKLARTVKPLSSVFLKELIWREFFMQILFHFPYSAKNSFDPRYDKIEWRNNKKEFKRWCEGQTGYPVVDAGMRELNQTGFMHNRARMITASFLSKHLLIDWRWGERYFAEKLLDYDMAANVGNWQWAAGSGCDAAPYFRVFNPYIQAKKFDPKGEYVKKWVPEAGSAEYPEPMVEHEMARRRALITYKRALGK